MKSTQIYIEVNFVVTKKKIKINRIKKLTVTYIMSRDIMYLSFYHVIFAAPLPLSPRLYKKRCGRAGLVIKTYVVLCFCF